MNGLLRMHVFISFPFFFVIGPCSQFMDDNEDGESQKFLSNGLMKKKKYEEYHEEYVSSCYKCWPATWWSLLVTVQAATKVNGS